MLEDSLTHILFVTMRWLHIVCTTLVVGGTLFFEFVVPIAIEDLKKEQQLATFGKARWVFKRVIVASAALLLVSGSVSLFRQWNTYSRPDTQPALCWSAAHVLLGIIGLGIALVLTTRRRPPNHQVGWMRINLVILLLAIFAANGARHVRLRTMEKQINSASKSMLPSTSRPWGLNE